MEDFGLCLTLDAVPCPFAEVFVTLDWLYIWLVTSLTLGGMDSFLPLAEVFVTSEWLNIWLVIG